MNRKLYESPENLEKERNVALFLEEKWKCESVKMPIKYGLDFALRRNKRLMGFCEIKCLNYEMHEFDSMSGGYFISLGKFMAAKTLVEFTKLPFFLVLNTKSGIFYRKFDNFDNLEFTVNGRKDRNDWQDFEPMVLLETSLFTQIGNFAPKEEKHWLDD
jgi:hypothetical protein